MNEYLPVFYCCKDDLACVLITPVWNEEMIKISYSDVIVELFAVNIVQSPFSD